MQPRNPAEHPQTPRTMEPASFRLRTMPSTTQGMALYERAADDYPEPFRSEVMATVHLIEKEAAS